ncbi:MAG: DEAD/DEAH box helicase [Helicobacteraceae bacterium]|jgi:ATP-dependent RNA helicase RhlE|nr:DEAD/DEAH box helicase [Helicobacteraceae bacterium]
MSFTTLGLSKPILRAIEEQGYTTPTPIQKQAIPIVLARKDVLAGAQTGTGKTAGFTLPLLQLLSDAPKQSGKPKVRALILTPTRELAAQVAESVQTYGKYLPFKSTVIFGGVGSNPQIDKLKRGIDIVIATPGRLLDLANQGHIDLSTVDFFVLDEADRMLDMGFIHDIKKVMAMLPKKRQNLLFSATFSEEIKTLADRLLNSPELIEVARRNTSAESVTQHIYPVDRDRKRELLSHLISDNNWKQVLVFTRTKHGANRLTEQLGKDGIPAAAIHGNKSQSARTKALADFKLNKVRVLVATDIAARGIDIDQLPHVVNYELPNVPEDYVHRIGRTGRAGNEGEAISLVCVDEIKLLKDIERLIKKEVRKVREPGFDVDPNIVAEPIQQRSAGRGGNRGRPGASRPNSTTSATRQDAGRGQSGARPATKQRSRDSHRGNR